MFIIIDTYDVGDSNYVGLVRLVVASAIGDDGEELFPRKWSTFVRPVVFGCCAIAAS